MIADEPIAPRSSKIESIDSTVIARTMTMKCMISAVQKKTLSDSFLYVRPERAVFAVADEAPD